MYLVSSSLLQYTNEKDLQALNYKDSTNSRQPISLLNTLSSRSPIAYPTPHKIYINETWERKLIYKQLPCLPMAKYRLRTKTVFVSLLIPSLINLYDRGPNNILEILTTISSASYSHQHELLNYNPFSTRASLGEYMMDFIETWTPYQYLDNLEWMMTC